MCLKTKFFLVFSWIGLLSACGGGGGSSSSPDAVSDKSLVGLEMSFSSLRKNVYSGITEQALLDTSNVKDFAALLTVKSSNEEALSALVVGSQLRTIKAVLPLLRSSLQSSENRARFAKPAHRQIEETVVCGQSGTMQVSGELDSNGVGGVGVEYRECGFDGVVFGGSGAIYFHGNSDNHVTNFSYTV